MKESVTRIIYKKGDKRNLKHWRPISLLNVDYKICSKALTNRLALVLPKIIDTDRTCSIPGRSIFNNLNLIHHVLDYIGKTSETGILLSLDQEKAFDRVYQTLPIERPRKIRFWCRIPAMDIKSLPWSEYQNFSQQMADITNRARARSKTGRSLVPSALCNHCRSSPTKY